MSENKNQSQCMYQSVPAAAAMNRVPGFEPLNFLRMAVSEDTKEKVWKLDLRYMKAWFRMARPNGRMKLKSLRITEQMAIFEAQVYMDRSDEEPFSNYIAQCTAAEAKSGDYIREAQDAALAAALNNAGFGIQFADLTGLGMKEQYGSEIPVSKEQTGKADAPGTAPAQMPIQAQQPVSQAAAAVQKAVQPTPQAAAVQKAAQPTPQAAAMQKTVRPTPQAATVEKAAQPTSQVAAVQKTIQPMQQPVSQAAVAAQKAAQPTQQPITQAMGQKTVQPNPQPSPQVAAVQGTAQPNRQAVSQAATTQRTVQPTQQAASQAAAAQKAVRPIQQPVSQAAVQQKVAQPQPAPVLRAAAQTVRRPSQQPAPQAAMAQNVVQMPQTVAAAAQQPAGEHLPVMPEETCLPVGEQPASAAAQPSEESLPVAAESIPVKEDAQEQAAEPGYMPGTPVEEILSRMTFEEAQKVVVDVGACKGWTMAEVADRRPPSLKYYVYGGYKGDNNILRAAAKIMLDSLEAKKAG